MCQQVKTNCKWGSHTKKTAHRVQKEREKEAEILRTVLYMMFISRHIYTAERLVLALMAIVRCKQTHILVVMSNTDH